MRSAMVPESTEKQSANICRCEVILSDDALLLKNRPNCTHTPQHMTYIYPVCVCVCWSVCVCVCA